MPGSEKCQLLRRSSWGPSQQAELLGPGGPPEVGAGNGGPERPDQQMAHRKQDPHFPRCLGPLHGGAWRAPGVSMGAGPGAALSRGQLPPWPSSVQQLLFPQCPAQLRAPALWGAPAEAGLGNCAESSFSVCTRARAHAHTRTQARHPLAGSCLVPSGISHPPRSYRIQ